MTFVQSHAVPQNNLHTMFGDDWTIGMNHPPDGWQRPIRRRRLKDAKGCVKAVISCDERHVVIPGLNVPETIVAAMPGRRVSDIVSHHRFAIGKHAECATIVNAWISTDVQYGTKALIIEADRVLLRPSTPAERRCWRDEYRHGRK